MRSVLIRAGADVNVTPPLPEVINDDQEADEDVFDALVDAEVDDASSTWSWRLSPVRSWMRCLRVGPHRGGPTPEQNGYRLRRLLEPTDSSRIPRHRKTDRPERAAGTRTHSDRRSQRVWQVQSERSAGVRSHWNNRRWDRVLGHNEFRAGGATCTRATRVRST